MQNVIKELGLLKGLPPDQIDLMEKAAAMHKQHASITFKIKAIEKKSVIIQVSQAKSAAGHYFNQKRLIEIVHETFERFFPGQTIKVHAIPYAQPAPSVVSALWVNAKMIASGTKLKDMVAETGIDKTQLSALISGSRPMSQTVKALFYFYFLAKETNK